LDLSDGFDDRLLLIVVLGVVIVLLGRVIGLRRIVDHNSIVPLGSQLLGRASEGLGVGGDIGV
jgi:hypothetical protein